MYKNLSAQTARESLNQWLLFIKKSPLQNSIRMTLSPRVFFLPTFLLFSQGNLMPDLHLRFTYISIYWNWTSFVYTGGSLLTKSISTDGVSMSTSMKWIHTTGGPHLLCFHYHGSHYNNFWLMYSQAQGVKVYSGKSLSSKFGRNQCLYWNKWYTRRKPLISALIWHLESDCSLKNVSYTFHRRQEVKNPFRAHKIQQNMLFAARGRGALLIMPRPLLGCEIKAEIQGFLLRLLWPL